MGGHCGKPARQCLAVTAEREVDIQIVTSAFNPMGLSQGVFDEDLVHEDGLPGTFPGGELEHCSKFLPPAYRMVEQQVPGVFEMFSDSACVVEPVATPMSEFRPEAREQRVLVMVPVWAVDDKMLQRLRVHGHSSRVCRLRNFWQEGDGMVLEFDRPQGISLEQHLRCKGCLSTSAGKDLCQKLMREVSCLHKNMLWLRGCIHKSSVFVGDDGCFTCLVPITPVLSASGLKAFVDKVIREGARDGLAPELLAAHQHQDTRLLTDLNYQGVIDGFATSALTLEALTMTSAGKVEKSPLIPVEDGTLDFFIRSLHKSADFRLDIDVARFHRWMASPVIR
jgi:hypothetical protein